MAKSSGDDTPVLFHGTVGDPGRLVKTAPGGVPEATRIRVRFGGTLAAEYLSSGLAAELEALVEQERALRAQPAPEAPADTPEVSLCGLGLSSEAAAALKHRIREHIRARQSGKDNGHARDAQRPERGSR